MTKLPAILAGGLRLAFQRARETIERSNPRLRFSEMNGPLTDTTGILRGFVKQGPTEFEKVRRSGLEMHFSLHTVDGSAILGGRSYFALGDHTHANGHSQGARLRVETVRRLRSKQSE